MNALAARRRHPATLFVLLLAMLLVVGTAYAVAKPQDATATASASTAQDVEEGKKLFLANCAMCHNAVGSGCALTRGKWAPTLRGVEGKHIYEAMQTGPQSMPVFNDANLSPEAKRDVITFLKAMDEDKNPGGAALGNLGPVPEGLLAWTLGIGLMILAAVWLGKKAA